MCSRSPQIVDLDWPQPDAQARAHSEKLIAVIRERIEAAGGWISFADYMQAALYEPGLGYYSAGAAKFGVEGDFVTAPEIAPLFSRCLANQCAQILMASGGDTIVEPGAGTGIMAAEILALLERLDALPERYVIVEPSAGLRERQRETIAPRHHERVQWLDAPPARIDGLVVGNEVLDAIPFERFVVGDEGLDALGVGLDGERFVAARRAADASLAAAVRDLEQALGRSFEPGFGSEVRPALKPFVADWSRRLRSGAIIWIDYGCSRSEYYARQRAGGTLRCHYRHRAHDDPFVYPGLQDITAWVDFTAVAEAGVAEQLSVSGYTTQAHFLVGCGIEQQFNAMRQQAKDEREAVQLSNSVRQLLLPGEMGERFRVIALERNLDTDLLGFSARDMAASL